MNSLTKNQKVILLIILSVFIIGGIFYLDSLSKKKTSAPPETKAPPKEEEKYITRSSSLAATISEVNVSGNYLMVRSDKDKKEVKVILDNETEIIQLKFPFDPGHPPEGKNITLEEVPIKIEDLKAGNQILIKAGQDIAGKSEFNNVTQIQVMP